jgi:hypothetical protein
MKTLTELATEEIADEIRLSGLANEDGVFVSRDWETPNLIPTLVKVERPDGVLTNLEVWTLASVCRIDDKFHVTYERTNIAYD